MKLEIGKYYESRKGDIYGPLIESTSHKYPFTTDEQSFTWTEEGCWRADEEDEDDLIREVPGPDTITPSSDPKGESGSLKPALHLIPTEALNELAASLADGARRYGARNWRKTRVKASTYIGAMMRHTAAYNEGEDRTTDSLVTHLGAIMANCAILLDASKHGCLEDDRPTTSKQL